MREKFLDQLKELLVSQLNAPNVKIILFGSSARGNFRASSDIDVGILSKETVNSQKLTILREKIERMNVPYKVELVYLNESSNEFREEALKGAHVWKDWN